MQSFIANFNMGSLNPIGVFELVDCLRGQAGLWIRATCYRTFSLEPTMADCVNEWALWNISDGAFVPGKGRRTHLAWMGRCAREKRNSGINTHIPVREQRLLHGNWDLASDWGRR
jgi:hypothetical protein